MLLESKKLVAEAKRRQIAKVNQLGSKPKLAIIKANQDAASAAYIGVKQKYANDIGAAVEIYDIDPSKLKQTIAILNSDPSVHGIIIQLPLPATIDNQSFINQILDSKDVDGLRAASPFDPPTPTAITWLLAGYEIDLKSKSVLIIGQGQLVGKPLGKIFGRSQIKFTIADENTKDLPTKIKTADIIISATGQVGLLTNDLIKPNTVIIDAGTSEVGGKLTGDVDPALYKREDIKISPVPGGVGPLTVVALFDNLLKAASHG